MTKVSSAKKQILLILVAAIAGAIQPTTTRAAPSEQPKPAPIHSKKAKPKRKIASTKDSPEPATQDFSKYKNPIALSPQMNKVGFISPQLTWNFESGKILFLNDVRITDRQFAALLEQKPRSDVPWLYRVSDRSSELVTTLAMRWPTFFTDSGTVEFEDTQHKVLWKTDATMKAREEWSSALKDDNKQLWKSLKESSIGWFDIDTVNHPLIKKDQVFRSCLVKQLESEHIRLCSPYVRVEINENKIHLLPAPQTASTNKDTHSSAQVRLENLDVGSEGVVNFPQQQKPVHFEATFSSGAYFKVLTRPTTVDFYDMFKSEDGKYILLSGRGPKPLGRVEDLQVAPKHIWAPTGIELVSTWQIKVPIDEPTLEVKGSWNIPFKILIDYDTLPQANERVLLHYRSIRNTYSSQPKVKVAIPSGGTLSSKEKSVSQIAPNEYIWTMHAPKKGGKNYSRIFYTSALSGQTFVGEQEMFRGYPYEISARLSGVVDSSLSFVTMAEAAGSFWFENIFGSQSHALSVQRWGIHFKHFRSLTPIRVSEDEGSTPSQSISSSNLDFKYNFTRGLWNHDELLGLNFSFLNSNVGGIASTLYGGGLFWARTMPKIFDDIFNIIPFLRYRKYVDLEFILFPFSASSGLQSGSTFQMNFHGKIFWGERVFGEAGFGFRQYDLLIAKDDTQMVFSAAYATFGFGWMF